MAKKINVLLVDDHAVVRTGYKTYLSLSEDIGEIYEADRGELACQLYIQYTPDIVLLDLSMPGIGGFETIKRLIHRDPHCKIIIFSMYDELIYATRAIKAGAKGYITKNSMPDTLITAVRRVAQGGTYIETELAQQMVISMTSGLDDSEKIKLLSPREFDIFCLLANGYTTRQVSEKLCLGYKTVCNHGTAIKEKLGIMTTAEMTLLALRERLIKTVEE
ncbi:MAG: response regulator transcription factor [Methylococcales bacterium]|nr:response regulator transcription factor [Methylococcales bacterium]